MLRYNSSYINSFDKTRNHFPWRMVTFLTLKLSNTKTNVKVFPKIANQNMGQVRDIPHEKINRCLTDIFKI